ncbi:MAG TPA: hypothetical protein VL401_03565 [Alphaproteobacteria bacterium]|jgi:hypothetical protein|nr:hypothetical protein [Alphaproteobacteria bacterium]
MALDKLSTESDQIGNLYRSALYLAKGSTEMGLQFLDKSGRKFDNIKIDNETQRLFWAEKILDEYIKLKHA